MIEVVEAITAALSSGVNPVTAIRDATGYTLEQMAVTSGLATSELMELETGVDSDLSKLSRLATALGLPDGVIEA